MITVLPQQAKLDGMAYMGHAGKAVETRTIQSLMNIIDARYGETDIERYWPWHSRFAEFPRAPCGNLKGFRGRYLRTTTRPDTMDVTMSVEMMFPTEIQALKLYWKKIHIVL